MFSEQEAMHSEQLIINTLWLAFPEGGGAGRIFKINFREEKKKKLISDGTFLLRSSAVPGKMQTDAQRRLPQDRGAG